MASLRAKICFGAAALAMGLAAVAPVSAQTQAGWSYAYVEGVATATERSADGQVLATMTCRPPTGDIVLTDYTFNQDVRRAEQADVRIGQRNVTVPAVVAREGGMGRRRYVVSINLPQRPPVLAAVQPQDQLSITVSGRSRTLHEGGPKQMEDLAYACWGS